MSKKINKPAAQKKQVQNPIKKQATKVFQYEKGFFKKYWNQISIIFALGVGLYIYSVTFDYVLDDQIVITKNQFTKKGLAGISDIMKTESMQGYFGEQKNLVVGARYRPLSIVSFAIEYQLWGLNSFMSHLINILLYAFTGLLLYRVLLMLFPANEKTNPFFNIPFITALLYIAHPIHSEVVANVKGRDEIMTLLGALGSMYFTFKYLANRNALALWLSGVCFFLGLLSKENAITFVAVIPLTVYVFSNASGPLNFKTTIPLIIATLLYLIIRYNVIGYFLSNGEKITDLMNNPFAQMNLGEKLATIFYTLLIYLKLQIFPHPLTHDYYPYAIPKMNWTSIWSILSLLIHVGLGVFALRNIKKKTILSYAILFYLLTISIVSNIVFPVGTFMNERFVYISSIGFLLVISWLVVNVLPTYQGGKFKAIGYSLFAILLLGFSVKTIARVPAWKNKLSLNTAAIEYSYNSARANCFMATALFEEFQNYKDNPAKQKELLVPINKYINRSLEIYPDYYSALQMYSGILGANYMFDRNMDNALEGFYKVITRRPNMSYVDEFLDYLDKIPDSDKTKLKNFYFKVGYDYFYKEKKQLNNAGKYIQRMLRLDPADPMGNYAMYLISNESGDTAGAERYRQNAISLNPNIATFFNGK